MTNPQSPIRILIAETDQAMRHLIRTVLANEGYAMSEASTGEDAYALATQTPPHLAIVASELSGMDGYTLCRQLRKHRATHACLMLMIASRGDIAERIAGYEAGANDYLVKPFQPQELVYRVKALLERVSATVFVPTLSKPRGQVIACFSAKGGVGKTTTSANLSLAMQKRAKARVALFDANFHFGDVGIHLNLPSVRSIMDLIGNVEQVDEASFQQMLLTHPSGLHVLLSPPHPEDAERISDKHVRRVLELFRKLYTHIIVDCPDSYDDRTLVLLEESDIVLLIITPEIGPLRNLSVFLELADRLELPTERFRIVLNRSGSEVGIKTAEIERVLKQKITFHLISGGVQVVSGANQGVPLFASQPHHRFSQQIAAIADYLIQQYHKAHAQK
jgi:pilus assembly protein CpaE